MPVYISVKEEVLSQSKMKWVQKQMAERNLFLSINNNYFVFRSPVVFFPSLPAVLGQH